MPPGEGTTQAGSGDKGSQDEAAKKAEEAKAAEEAKKAEEAKDKETQYVTPTILTGVLDVHKRKATEEIEKLASQNVELSKKLDALIESSTGAPPEGGKFGKEKISQESIELQRTVDQLKSRLDESEANRTKAERDFRDSQFESTVKDSLVKAGCVNPDAAFLVIKPRLHNEEDGSRIYAKYDDPTYGPRELELDQYIKDVFSEDVLPDIFKGKMKGGSPAGGDAAGGQGSYTLTHEQITPAAYIKDPEKYREALEKGKVKGISRPGEAGMSTAIGQ